MPYLGPGVGHRRHGTQRFGMPCGREKILDRDAEVSLCRLSSSRQSSSLRWHAQEANDGM